MAIETKDRILDAAEQLFADQGFAATSLRRITAEAGVNLAAVNYHFGSKDALLRAVFERRINPVNEERLRELEALEAQLGDGQLPLETVLTALLGPPLRMFQEWGVVGDRFMRLVGWAHSSPSAQVQRTFQNLFTNVFERFVGALQRALPRMPPKELVLRFHFVIGAMAHTLAWSRKIARMSRLEFEGGELDVEQLLARLVGFTAAGLQAPLTEVPRKEGS